MSERTSAYTALVEHLAKVKYAFVCPSPETQGRVVEKRTSTPSSAEAKNAQDFFGWNLPCTRETFVSIVPEAVSERLLRAGVITSNNNKYRSTVRVSNFYLPHVPRRDLDSSSLYYIHSSFPAAADAVFFGPDTYLFTSWLQTAVRHLPHAPTSIIDVCCGSGAGAIHLARTYPKAQVLGLDLNPHALSLGDVNAHLAGVNVDFHESNLYAAVPQALKSSGIDLIVSNPPYIAATTGGKALPIYADGGADFGLGISLRIVEEAIEIVSATGVIMLYTGVAIPTAEPAYDALLDKLQRIKGIELLEYTILHPDMWSEEIGQGAYADVCRIQVVGAVLRKQK
ncbi:S-adenosyl-L-methionine-dependent methyltransferase [Karstenula rhodostoma CBS 690.94]|uniref:S-adenosyl-L-methionine-dependent methyltransferase n=1 Tax=Karstenula rhodostoma CBS 690.94 TaxID=1392251 RepID=A0A9P4UIC9_9PLEO|nr:S-adenosyl-L-methionine-dependent methyltransferase [Karstenula rhodostoma CBS 690.94]